LVKGQRDFRFNLECDDENICTKEAENARRLGKTTVMRFIVCALFIWLE
jgi:hypothetical protein